MGTYINGTPTAELNITRRATKSLTYTGAANLGAVGAVPLFTITGEVLIVALAPYCVASLTGNLGATIALGVTGSPVLLVAATPFDDIDTGEFWVAAVPVANGVALPATLQNIVITDNIINTIGVDDVTGGTIRYDVYWLKLSSNGNLAAA